MTTLMSKRLALTAILMNAAMAYASTQALVFNTEPGTSENNVAWPDPRFSLVDNGNCVRDHLTGLMWLANANYSLTNGLIFMNPTDWDTAQTDISNFNQNGGACGYTDWRLPNITELKSLVNYSDLTNPMSPVDYLNGSGFTNVQSAPYWSSTLYVLSGGSQAWYIGMNSTGTDIAGDSVVDSKGISHYIWPVRGGQ